MKKKLKEPLFAVAFLLVVALLLGIAATALRPIRVDYGAVWGPFLAEPRDSLDYLYLGSSYAYCDVNPAEIYGASGLTGHVLAGPEQTLSVSYYYLKEALKTQKPAAVFIEASALHFERFQAYTQVNVGYMPFSRNKIEAIFTASEPDLRTGLLFDLYFYHSRWKDITPQQALEALAPVGVDHLKGFTGVSGVFENIGDGPFHRETKDEALYQQNLADLNRILTLCREQEIRAVVTFHPTYSQLAPAAYARVGADVAALAPEALYYDWSGVFTAFGIDPALHFYDPGHLNQEGAAVFSARLGAVMTEVVGLTPRAQSARNAAAWGEP